MAEEKKVEAAEKDVEAKAKTTKKTSKKVDIAELEKVQVELATQKDLVLRTAAEFDNFKRRTEKERLAAAEFTSANLLKKLLPIFDNVDRALAADKESADYAKGIEMIVKMLGDVVKDLGLIEIGAVGDAFDPNLHEAVMHIEDDNFGDSTVCNVLQKGYKFGDTVIRPATVAVAN